MGGFDAFVGEHLGDRIDVCAKCNLERGKGVSGEENCIGFHPILSVCKRRNPQNLVGSVPNVPTSANILTQIRSAGL